MFPIPEDSSISPAELNNPSTSGEYKSEIEEKGFGKTVIIPNYNPTTIGENPDESESSVIVPAAANDGKNVKEKKSFLNQLKNLAKNPKNVTPNAERIKAQEKSAKRKEKRFKK